MVTVVGDIGLACEIDDIACVVLEKEDIGAGPAALLVVLRDKPAIREIGI